MPKIANVLFLKGVEEIVCKRMRAVLLFVARGLTSSTEACTKKQWGIVVLHHLSLLRFNSDFQRAVTHY
jgi:hypothetical protein